MKNRRKKYKYSGEKYENSPKKEAWPLGSKIENAVTEPKNLPLVQHREVNPNV